MEAELVAGALAMKATVFCSNMVIELGFAKEFENVPLHIDITAIFHVGNRGYSSRRKDIALRFFYVRELVSEGKITIHYISTEDQLVDIGTKHLNKHRLHQLLHKSRNSNLTDINISLCYLREFIYYLSSQHRLPS